MSLAQPPPPGEENSDCKSHFEEHSSQFAALEMLGADIGSTVARMKNEIRHPEFECCCPKCNGQRAFKQPEQSGLNCDLR